MSLLCNFDAAVPVAGSRWSTLPPSATIFSVGQRDAAQAVELVRALREKLDEMTAQLVVASVLIPWTRPFS